MTRMILFLCFVIILGGLAEKWREGTGITVIPLVTESPPPLSQAFDETPDKREVSTKESTWYAIQLAAFENKEAADELALSYQSRGAAGVVLFAGNRYRVLASVYSDKEDAQAVRNQLKSTHEIDSYIYEMVIPEMTLKISGVKGQIDVLAAAMQFLRDGLYEIQKISVALDQKEANRQDVANNIKILAMRANELNRLFETRFANPKHTTAQRLQELLKMYIALETFENSQDSGAVVFAAKLKELTISMIEKTQAQFKEIMQ